MRFNRKTINTVGKTVLFISDQHFCYSHKDIFKFLRAIKKKYKPQLIVNLGDEIDNAAISFHEKSPEMLNPSKELEKSIDELKKLRDIFPKQYVCNSNHGSLAMRRFRHAGIPIKMLQPLSKLYDTPNFEWHDEILIQTKLGKVLACHGDGKKAARLATAKEEGMSVVMGHHHSLFEISYMQSNSSVFFQMICGCLADPYHKAFEYGKKFSKKHIIGTGMIDKNGEPFLIRMNLDEKGRWTGKL
jgi:predicted MPP superfamily phosphohydrolase